MMSPAGVDEQGMFLGTSGTSFIPPSGIPLNVIAFW